MKIRELMEANTGGAMPKDLEDKSQGSILMRDQGGYDRTYHLNRIMMATAIADGSNKKPVDMDSSSFTEKYNVAFPYTDLEHLMMMQAMATIPTDGKELAKRSKSIEPSDTNIQSPISNWNAKKTTKRSKKD
jgi:hypothetical protein